MGNLENHVKSLECDSTSEDPLGEDAVVRETIATLCFPHAQMRVWAMR